MNLIAIREDRLVRRAAVDPHLGPLKGRERDFVRFDIDAAVTGRHREQRDPDVGPGIASDDGRALR